MRARRLSLGGGYVVWGRRERDDEPARLLRARSRRLARLRDAAPSSVHAVAPLVRRDRRGARSRPRGGALGGGAGGVLPRGRHRCACARRAARAPAPDADLGPGAHVARGRVDRRRSRHRRVRLDRVHVVARAARRRGWIHRLRLQPRALRRRVPLRCLVRAGLGSFSVAHRLCGGGRAPDGRSGRRRSLRRLLRALRNVICPRRCEPSDGALRPSAARSSWPTGRASR